MTTLEQMGARAKEAARQLTLCEGIKDQALTAVAKALRDHTKEILAANAIDLKNGEENGMKQALMDRLRLTEERIEGMAQGVDDIVALKTPSAPF